MKVRPILFWIHLCAGATAGIVILIMSVTGIALAFERQINDIADRAGRPVVQPGAFRIPIDEIAQKNAGSDAALSAVTVYAARDEPVALAFGRERTMFVDPYTGKILGEGSKTSRAIFAAMERWHRALGTELRGRDGAGRAVADAANVVFLVLILTGVVLWWPRKWKRSHWRAAALFRRNLSGKAADWNRHTVIGIWCAAPLFIIVLTGVIMSYTWANTLLFSLTGSPPPPPNAPRQEQIPGARHKSRVGVVGRRVSLETLFDRARSQVAGWRSITLRWTPDSPNAVFMIDQGNGGQPNKRAQLTLDGATGEVRRWEPFGSYSAGRQLRSWARFLHTGEAGGLVGQAIATAAAFGGVLLVWTGLSMAWIRLRQMVLARSSGDRAAVPR